MTPTQSPTERQDASGEADGTGAPEVPTAGPGAAPTDRRRLAVSGVALLVLLVGLVLTGALAALAAAVNTHEDQKLLHDQVEQAGSLISAVVPSVETPLASAAEVAVQTNGNVASFQAYLQNGIGTPDGFTTVSLWRMGPGAPTRVALVGPPSELSTQPTRLDALLAKAQEKPELQVIGLLSGRTSRLGFAFAPSGQHTWVVYAESVLRPSRRVHIAASSPYSDLNFAIYIGRHERTRDVFATSTSHLPLTGTVSTLVVPFGAAHFTLVASPDQELTGALSADLPWIIVGAGLLLSGLAFAVTEFVVRRRRAAEALAAENRRLYRAQHGIASVLQNALLPSELPAVSGLDVAARYEAGAGEADIGGDWYDVLELEDGRVLFAVGDVSGRGVQAATVMARLHFAIRAYAAEGDEPAEILRKLSTLLDVTVDGHFATVLCGLVDVAERRLEMASAGHLPPLLVAAGEGRYLRSDVGPPIGAVPGATYTATSLTVPPGACVLAFTDGLVERPADGVEAGLERLRSGARDPVGDLDAFLDALVRRIAGSDPADDTVVLALRWQGDRVGSPAPTASTRSIG